MRRQIAPLSPAEEAQFEKDVRAVFEEAGGALTEDEIIERVRHREIQRAVDRLVADGLLMEVEKGSYFPTQKGWQWVTRAR